MDYRGAVVMNCFTTNSDISIGMFHEVNGVELKASTPNGSFDLVARTHEHNLVLTIDRKSVV